MPAELDSGHGRSTAALTDEIRAVLASKGKIEAIKLYREHTGEGLAVSKGAIEHFEASGVLDVPEHYVERMKRVEIAHASVAVATAEAASAGSGLTPEVLEEVRRQLRAGMKIMAIKLYREATGCSLFEAKNAVESMT